MKVRKLHTLPRHLIYARCLDPAAIQTHVATAQIIRQDDNDIRSLDVRAFDLGRNRRRRDAGCERKMQTSRFMVVSSKDDQVAR